MKSKLILAVVLAAVVARGWNPGGEYGNTPSGTPWNPSNSTTGTPAFYEPRDITVVGSVDTNYLLVFTDRTGRKVKGLPVTNAVIVVSQTNTAYAARAGTSGVAQVALSGWPAQTQQVYTAQAGTSTWANAGPFDAAGAAAGTNAAHVAATDPHGDRAYASGLLATGTAARAGVVTGAQSNLLATALQPGATQGLVTAAYVDAAITSGTAARATDAARLLQVDTQAWTTVVGGTVMLWRVSTALVVTNDTTRLVAGTNSVGYCYGTEEGTWANGLIGLGTVFTQYQAMGWQYQHPTVPTRFWKVYTNSAAWKIKPSSRAIGVNTPTYPAGPEGEWQGTFDANIEMGCSLHYAIITNTVFVTNGYPVALLADLQPVAALAAGAAGTSLAASNTAVDAWNYAHGLEGFPKVDVGRTNAPISYVTSNDVLYLYGN